MANVRPTPRKAGRDPTTSMEPAAPPRSAPDSPAPRLNGSTGLAGPSRRNGTARSRSAERDGVRAATAVGYLRRSTDRQEQSIPDQQHAVETYCAENALTLVRCYTDDAISGTSTVGRHAFQKMLGDAQRPGGADFGVIVVYDVKRFGRVDNDEAGYYRHVLRQHGVEVRYASENFTGDGTDDLLRPVKQWQARQESKDLSKVTIRGLLTKSGTGHWMGGAPPYGYDLRYESQTGQFLFYLRYLPDGSKIMFNEKWRKVRTLQRGETVAVSRKDHCTLIPSDPARVKTVRRIFRMYVEQGMGYKAIADLFNLEKVPSARGPAWAEHYSGQWAMTTVRAILVNPAYCGDVAWNRRTDARFHKIKDGVAIERKDVHARRLELNDRSDWTVVRDAHPAIVTRRNWELAQSTVENKAASSTQRGVDQRRGAPVQRKDYRKVGDLTGPRSRFLLSRLVACARCGSRYEGYTLRSARVDAEGGCSRRYYYACGGYIRRGKSVCDLGKVPQEILEEAVIKAVVGFYARYQDEEGKRLLAAEIRSQLGLDNDEVAATLRRVREDLARVEATTRRLLDNITPTSRTAVERRLAELEDERQRLEAKADSLERLGMSKAEVHDLIQETAAFMARLEPTLHEGPLHERQAAMRRCIDKVEFDHARGRAHVRARSIPRIVPATQTQVSGTVALVVAARVPSARASA